VTQLTFYRVRPPL